MLTVIDCGAGVRLAGPGDEEDLLAMLEARHGDGEWILRDQSGQPFPFNAWKARAIIQSATVKGHNDPDASQAWIGVVSAGDKLQGSAYVMVQSPWDADGSYLVERWNWVYPAFRKTDASKLLISFSMAIADALRMTLVSASQPREISAKSRLYERKIGSPVGSLFQYNNRAVGAA